MAISRGILFDRRGNPSWLALGVVAALVLYVYHGESTEPDQPAVRARPTLPHPAGPKGVVSIPSAVNYPLADALGQNTHAESRAARDDAAAKQQHKSAVTAPPNQPVVDSSRHGYQDRPERQPVSDYRPVSLTLQLPDKYLNEPALATRESMFKQYGFNLKVSNGLPLAREQPDIRKFVPSRARVHLLLSHSLWRGRCLMLRIAPSVHRGRPTVPP